MILIQLYSYSHYLVAEEVFVSYLDEWDKSVKSTEGVGANDKKRMTISTETLFGLRMTG